MILRGELKCWSRTFTNLGKILKYFRYEWRACWQRNSECPVYFRWVRQIPSHFIGRMRGILLSAQVAPWNGRSGPKQNMKSTLFLRNIDALRRRLNKVNHEQIAKIQSAFQILINDRTVYFFSAQIRTQIKWRLSGPSSMLYLLFKSLLLLKWSTFCHKIYHLTFSARFFTQII